MRIEFYYLYNLTGTYSVPVDGHVHGVSRQTCIEGVRRGVDGHIQGASR